MKKIIWNNYDDDDIVIIIKFQRSQQFANAFLSIYYPNGMKLREYLVKK
jgi:hypothetical protein